jgi:uncharacterized protein (DUF1684 family)
MMKRFSTYAFVCLLLISCGHSYEISEEEHLAEIEAWHQQQMASLQKENGWLNLIGLFWLEEGRNTFGTGEDMDLIIEKGDFAKEIGQFELTDGKVYFLPAVEGVKSGEKDVKEKLLVFDPENEISEALSYSSLNWTIIKRTDAYGVRLRDFNAEAVRDFEGVDQFPIDLNWRIIADFVPYTPSKSIPITNVIGQTYDSNSPGFLKFEIDGKSYQIDALGEEADERLFLIFADETSGRETYGGGRYMYVDKADRMGKIILDFNKAYNPPCVYTAYATCPLPPRQNMLDVPIAAGHLNFGAH